jgi:hypothetical protein
MKCKNCGNAMRIMSYNPDDNTVQRICDWCNFTAKSVVLPSDTEEIINLKRAEDYYDE